MQFGRYTTTFLLHQGDSKNIINWKFEEVGSLKNTYS